MADIFMHFKGENGTKMTFELNIVVHPTINQDFLLGRDFAGSDFKVAETNSHFYLSQNYAIYCHNLEKVVIDKKIVT